VTALRGVFPKSITTGECRMQHSSKHEPSCCAAKRLVQRSTYPDGNGATMEGKIMRKMIMALMLSAAFIISGISVTTFSTGQLTMTAWANGGD
jgi:hypothetical protein